MRSEPQDNGALHGYSIAGMVVLLAALGGGGYFASSAFAGGGPGKPKGPDLDKLEAIEASIAYKKAKPQAQPQKQKKAPDPVKKPDGVSHDADKQPVDKPKEDEPKSKPGEDNPLDKYKRHNEDEDLETGKPVDPTGDFNEKRFGWAAETKGEPYVQDLLADLIQAGGEYPALAASDGYPIGCFHMNADGKILDTILRERAQPENAELDDFAERSLNGLKKKRNADPIPIDLTNDKLRPLMTEWTCFKFNLDG